MDISELIGKTFIAVYEDEDEIHFITSATADNVFEGFKLYHSQDCCEHVYVESIVGDLSDLVDSPILMAQENTHEGETTYGSFTHTFYKFATIKGYVDIRFNGESNGYYSESVNFSKL